VHVNTVVPAYRYTDVPMYRSLSLLLSLRLSSGTTEAIIIIIIIIISCHRPILPGNSHEPTVIPTAQVSSFTLQYFPYYV